MGNPDEEHDSCLYSVLGVEKSSSSSEIRSAYRKLAMKWHPDKCSPSEQATTKFQDIQEAYSVLSDDKKRFLYDSGLYDEGDDEGMQSFMTEMVSMMATGPKQSSFDELRDMFNQMVDSYTPQASSTSQACSSSGSVEQGSSSSSSHMEPFPYEHSDSSFGGYSTTNFCIGRQEAEPMSKPRVQKKVPRRRKCPYDQGTRT